MRKFIIGTTLAQKIITRACGQKFVEPGEIVIAKVDLAMIHDSGGPRRVDPILTELNVDLFDSKKVVLISDHFVSSNTEEGDKILDFTRDWAFKKKVYFYDAEGICHIVLPEKGHLKPGMFAVGGDSHSSTGGALGAFVFGIGATEMASVLATGEIWLKVPETILIEWKNFLNPGVMAKDMMLALCGKIGMNGGNYQAIEYTGDAIMKLSIQERMTMSNMAAELGAQVGLIAPDNVTKEYIKKVSGNEENWSDLKTDKESKLLKHFCFDAASLVPQIAKPNSPANVGGIDEVEKVKLDIAYIGACTGAKYDDLKSAAKLLKGKKLAKNITLLIAPASRLDQLRAKNDGIMGIFESLGAKILPNACGLCAGYGSHRLGENINCISSTARNFKGRMGAYTSKVWLASPVTVAASSIVGEITDPRNFINSGNNFL